LNQRRPVISTRLKLLILAWLAPVALGLPFIGRAYFVDDHYHMLMAQGILENPSRPYDFRADDAGPDNAGWDRGQPPRMVNPPLHHYWLAFLWKASGGRLWAVRLGGLFLAGFTAVFIFRLAQRFILPPLPAALLCVLTPAFWLTSHTLLIDGTMLFFFLGALVYWIDGLRRKSNALLFLSGLFMAATVLTKYTGAYVGLLALLWWGLQEKEDRSWRALGFLLVPVVAMGAWAWWTTAAYGDFHLTAAARRMVAPFRWSQVLVLLSFFGGAFLLPLSSWGWARRRPRLLTGAATLASALWALMASPMGGFGPGQALMLSVFSVGALLFYAMLVAEAGAFRTRGDIFLLAWLALGTLQMMVAMAWVAGRYYLTLLPPVIFLIGRLGLSLHRHAPARLTRFQTAWGAGLLAIGVLLAAGDYAQARTSRRVVEDSNRDGWLSSGRRCFYLGDSFTASYLKYAGWQAAFEQTPLRAGDLLLHQEVTMPPWWFRRSGRRFRELKAYEYRSWNPVRVMDNRGSAGFYASVWGALPFTFSTGPLERYRLLEVLPGEGG